MREEANWMTSTPLRYLRTPSIGKRHRANRRSHVGSRSFESEVGGSGGGDGGDGGTDGGVGFDVPWLGVADAEW